MALTSQERGARYYARHKDKIRARKRAEYATNRDQECARKRARYAADPATARECARRWRHKKFGIPEPTRPMPSACESCQIDHPGASLVVDHDHITGKFRGWLCHNCNLAAGHLKDEPKRAELLAAYLRRATEVQ